MGPWGWGTYIPVRLSRSLDPPKRIYHVRQPRIHRRRMPKPSPAQVAPAMAVGAYDLGAVAACIDDKVWRPPAVSHKVPLERARVPAVRAQINHGIQRYQQWRGDVVEMRWRCGVR